MSAIRNLQPLLRTVGNRAAIRTATPFASTARSYASDSSPVLYTAHAKVTGARNGHIEGDEGLKLDLSMPKALGGSSGKTNPEELFAAGYGACFQSAMNAVAPSLGIKLPTGAQDSVVDAKVHLIGDMKQLDLGIKVDLHVKVKGVKKEDIEKVVAKTKEVCPYSRATQGNVTTNVTVESV